MIRALIIPDRLKVHQVTRGIATEYHIVLQYHMMQQQYLALYIGKFGKFIL